MLVKQITTLSLAVVMGFSIYACSSSSDSEELEGPIAPDATVVEENVSLEDENTKADAKEEKKAEETAEKKDGPSAEETALLKEVSEDDKKAAVALEKKEEPKAEAKPEATSSKSYWVDISHLNVRSGPGMSHEVVRVVTAGTKVNMIGRSGIWIQISENEYLSVHYLSEQQVDPKNPGKQPNLATKTEEVAPLEEMANEADKKDEIVTTEDVK